MIEASDRATAIETLREVGRRTVNVIAAIDDLDRPVPGLEWTVGEAATHILIEVRGYAEAVTGNDDSLANFVPDVDGYKRRMYAMTSGTLAAEPRRSAAELSALVREGLQTFIAEIAKHPDDEPLTTPWYGAGESVPMRAVLSLQIGEMLIHGLDVARGLRRPWPISRAEALQVILPATLEMMPKVVDHDAVGDASITYCLRFRGGPTVGARFVRGQLGTAGWGEWNTRADVTLSADPVAFLLLAYGRKSQWPLIAQGRLMAYGRKPWLALQMRGLFVNP